MSDQARIATIPLSEWDEIKKQQEFIESLCKKGIYFEEHNLQWTYPVAPYQKKLDNIGHVPKWII